MFQARSGNSNASVPLAQASACFAPANSASAFSKFVTSGPMMKPQVDSTRPMAASICGAMRWRWA